MITGVILAAGKGKRFGAREVNKTATMYLGKPLVEYGVDLLIHKCAEIIVIVGVGEESVRQALVDRPVTFVRQPEALGTGDAVRMAVAEIETREIKPDLVLVGYGDHMMFYKPEMLESIERLLQETRSVIGLITTEYDDPDSLVWGRIIRDETGRVIKIVEQKEATTEERLIKELNAGFYAFDYNFLRDNIGLIKPAQVSGEYYLTEMVDIAVSQGKQVAGLKVPFAQVGIGVNTQEEKEKSEKLYTERNKL